MTIYLADMPGSTWDSKLDEAFIRAKAATTTTPPIILPYGRIDLSKTRVLFDGCKLIYPHGHAGIQRAAQSIPCDIRWNGSRDQAAFILDHQTFDVGMTGFGFQANSGGIFADTRGHTIWTSVFRDLAFNGCRHVWGTPTSKFLNTACAWDGFHNYNNARGTQISLGGSDSRINASRFLMDVGGGSAQRAEFAAAKAWLVNLDWQQKTPTSGWYLTVEGDANGLRVVNGDNDHPTSITDSTIEGRNSRQPCKGTLLYLEGRVDVARVSVSYSAGNSMIVGSRGRVSATNLFSAGAPPVRVRSGGQLRISDSPGVAVDAEAGAVVVADDSVTLKRV